MEITEAARKNGKATSIREQLSEKLGEDKTEVLMRLRLEAAARELWYVNAMLAHGRTPYHGVNRKETAKRRARNKVARRQRAINRGN